jgi:two-component sensor histidine kinase
MTLALVTTLVIGGLDTVLRYHPSRLALYAGVVAAEFGLLLLLRSGHLRLTAILLLSFSSLAITLGAITGGGVQSNSFTAYVFVVFIAGLLLGSWGILVFVGVAILTGVGLLLAEAYAWLPPLLGPQMGWVELLWQIFYFLAAMVLSHITIKTIAERRSAEEQARVLLREMHHRIKNNLQLVSGLLSLQAGATGDEQMLAIFKESQDRIHSMALLHEILYQSGDLAQTNLAEYLHRLTDHLRRSYDLPSQAARLEFHVADVSLGTDEAVYCGLIINELVSNALKHAFPHGHGGEILVGLQQREGQVVLTVRDDGVGLPADLDPKQTGSLGLQLVSMLVQQVKGTCTVERDGGTAFEIVFGTAASE